MWSSVVATPLVVEKLGDIVSRRHGVPESRALPMFQGTTQFSLVLPMPSLR